MLHQIQGTLLNGDQVAIKKLHLGSQRGKKEFLNEVNVITAVQHKNLIRLLGCCVDGPERVLVYEYIANGSLERFLSGRGVRTLNWSDRINIIAGIAKGLVYLHEESQVRIIHRDIKPRNILLDDNLNPIIADFGLARLVQDDETHVNTGVAGTIGYLAPEYALHGVLSEKVDVYGFGMVALEIVAGKQYMPSPLLAWVWERYELGNVRGLVDDKMGGAFSLEQATRVVHTALLCTQENPKLRPSMSTVTQWLNGASVIMETPVKPTFLYYSAAAQPMPEPKQQVVPASTSTQFHSVSAGVQPLSEIAEPRR